MIAEMTGDDERMNGGWTGRWLEMM